MSPETALAVALVGAVLLLVAFSKPAKTMVGGIFMRDRKGRLVLVLTPTPKPKRKKRRRP